jgi:hypothetical protein
MARRIRRSIEEMKRDVKERGQYASADTPVAWREARTDPRRSHQYARERGIKLPRDLARRHLAERPFVAWDGEGYSTDDGLHHYMLFGASTGVEIHGESLGTRACLDLLLQVEDENPDVFHVIFAGNYDVNMMLKDVPVNVLRRLKKTGQVRWGEYSIGYIKSKMFRVRRGKTTVTLYDVFTFFGCSFVKALEQYIGEEDEDVSRIRHGKNLRQGFRYGDLGEVRQYFRSELRYLVRLCERLRRYLSAAGIRLAKWHGPGAVASAVLQTRGLNRVPIRKGVGTAAQYAYLGGRFEQFQIGTYNGAVYEYDIRSAYPAAIATLPVLGGEWIHTTTPREVRPFSLYRIDYRAHGGAERMPHPFGWRHTNGSVFYPPQHGGGWAWGIELAAALRLAPGSIGIQEAYEYCDSGERPYSWIAEMYDRRAEWKREGNPAQLALKLAMNSIYGKLAQQVGWRMTETGPKLPRHHQLEYAGYITAYARAALYTAAMQAPESLIATETDAVYTTAKLDLAMGEGLGEWDETQYDGIMYVQSGLYFAKVGDEWKRRTRGFARGDIQPETVLSWLGTIKDADSAYQTDPLSVSQTRFRTMGTSLGKPDWRTWVTAPREIHAGTPGGKREHYGPECISCELGAGSLAECLHQMIPAVSLKGVDFSRESTRYPLEWLGEKRSEYQGDNDDLWEDET